MNDLNLSTMTLATPACVTGLSPITYQGGSTCKFATAAAPSEPDEPAVTTIVTTIADDVSAAWSEIAPDFPGVEIVMDERTRIVGFWSVLDEKLRPVNFEIRRGDGLLLGDEGLSIYEAVVGRLDIVAQRQRFAARLKKLERNLWVLRYDRAVATANCTLSIRLLRRYDAVVADIWNVRRLLDVLAGIES